MSLFTRIPPSIFLCLGLAIPATAELHSLNPRIQKITAEVSEDRITSILKKLEGFGTRHTLSNPDDLKRGIGAARQWIAAEFRGYSPRLEVSFDSYKVKKQRRVYKDVEVVNVVAVLPGKLHPERQIVISGHYDSLNLGNINWQDTQAAAARGEERKPEDFEADAPGVTDDASGTAAVMELARVMSQYEFENTLVFVAFAGEEQGLLGSTLMAQKARKEARQIEAVLNNDIIGSILTGDARSSNGVVRVFADDAMDSPSRQLGRYIKEVGERYVPSMRVDLIFREDRFGRDGDHHPFQDEGFAAVRFSTPSENYENQHSATDTLANTSVPYIARVARINGAVAASLALAPPAPVVTQKIEKGPNAGHVMPTIQRGKSRYAALLKWKLEKPDADLAGFVVLMRSTTAPFWEHEWSVGKVNEFEFPDLSIDDVVFGVKAVDQEGNESLTSAYVLAKRPPRTIETY